MDLPEEPTVSKLQSSKSPQSQHESASDPARLQYFKALDAAERNFDIANTHQSNQELRQCENVKEFFAEAARYQSLTYDEALTWVGSLPTTMSNSAIPLFTDDKENDFQIHFSYTWMTALHTAGTKDANLIDPYVHRLLRVISNDELQIIEHPGVVVPIGKLFVNKSGHSIWTGYEVFVTSNTELWIVYILDKVDPLGSYPEEVRLSKWDVPGSKEDGQDEVGEPPIVRIARLWDSLGTVGSARISETEAYIRMYSIRDYVSSFHLLETLRTEASRIREKSDRLSYISFATETLIINAASGAGHELLMLANENARTPIMTLIGEPTKSPTEDYIRDLLSLAILYEDESIIQLVLQKGNVDINLKDKLGATPLSYAVELAAKRAVRSATQQASLAVISSDIPLGGKVFEYESSEQFLWASRVAREFASMRAADQAAKYTAKYAASLKLSRAASSEVSAAVFFAVFLVYRRTGLEFGGRAGLVFGGRVGLSFGEKTGQDLATDAGELAAAAAIEDATKYDPTLQIFLRGEILEKDIDTGPLRPSTGEAVRQAALEIVMNAIIQAVEKLNLTTTIAGETRPRDPLLWVTKEYGIQARKHIGDLLQLYGATYTKEYTGEYENNLLVKRLRKYQETQATTSIEPAEETTATEQTERSDSRKIAINRRVDSGFDPAEGE